MAGRYDDLTPEEKEDILESLFKNKLEHFREAIESLSVHVIVLEQVLLDSGLIDADKLDELYVRARADQDQQLQEIRERNIKVVSEAFQNALKEIDSSAEVEIDDKTDIPETEA